MIEAKTKRTSSILLKIEEEQTDVIPNFRIKEETIQSFLRLKRKEGN
jgi:hypothetical protein